MVGQKKSRKPRKKKPKYQTLSKAKAAVKKLGITSMPKYDLEYKQDPLLPSNPNVYYINEWKGAKDFFGTA